MTSVSARRRPKATTNTLIPENERAMTRLLRKMTPAQQGLTLLFARRHQMGLLGDGATLGDFLDGWMDFDTRSRRSIARFAKAASRWKAYDERKSRRAAAG